MITLVGIVMTFFAGFYTHKWLTPSRQDYSKMPRGDERVR